MLVNFDGNPIWSPIAANDLKFAVNTNWDVFELGPTKAYYLRVDDSWLKSYSVHGPFTPVASPLPPSFSKLPADENWKEVKSAMPGKTTDRSADTDDIRQRDAGGVDFDEGRTHLCACYRHGSAVGQQYRKRHLQSREDRRLLLPHFGPLVLGAGLVWPVDVCDA